MSNIIKKLRIRPNDENKKNSYWLDHSVELIKITNNKYEVNIQPLGGISVSFDYKLNSIPQSKKDFFRESIKNKIYDYKIINGFKFNNYQETDVLINEAILLKQKIDNTTYEIIQNPWEDEPPIFRKYGYDPYYLNNGTVVKIEWLLSSDNVGGVKWSNDDGSEKKEIEGSSSLDDDKTSYTKIVNIIPTDTSNDPNMIMSDKGISESGKYVEYDGSMIDLDIINVVLSDWKRKVPNYDVKLCDPNFVDCRTLKYVSPIGVLEEDTNDIKEENIEEEVNNEVVKEKLKIVLPNETFRVQKDIDFTVYIGDVADETIDINGFVYEEGDDMHLLSDEYIEDDFIGEEEIELIDNYEVVVFHTKELDRMVEIENVSSNINIGDSESKPPTTSVNNKAIILPNDLEKVQGSFRIRKQSLGGGKFRGIDNDIIAPNGNRIYSKNIISNMNAFINDVLGPFSTFLKSKYPNLYKDWHINSATRGYIPSGGSDRSQHLHGQAIDTQILGSRKANPQRNIELLNAILEWYKDNKVGYDQILFETRDSNSCWIHWSYSRSSSRLHLLKLHNDKTSRGAPVNTAGNYVLGPVTMNDLWLT